MFQHLEPLDFPTSGGKASFRIQGFRVRGVVMSRYTSKDPSAQTDINVT